VTGCRVFKNLKKRACEPVNVAQTIKFDKNNLNGLVCPECGHGIDLVSNGLHCSVCDRIYKVQEGVPCFVELDPSALPFREEYFEFWFERENKHFWHIARKEIIGDMIARYLSKEYGPLNKVLGLEIGIGNGNVSTELIRKGIQMEGADLFYSSLQYCRKRLDIPLYQTDLLKLPFREKYDLIGIYDIIEHIEDDRLALQNIYQALKPGGTLNVTVPACRFLWSQFDEMDHKRRYTKAELKEKLEAAGFKVRRISFFMFILFPIVYLVRKIQTYPKDTQLKHVHEVQVVPVINGLFLALFRFEKTLLRAFNLPIGSSLIAVAQKPLS
jgi:SAM-dependent methyltransferase